MTPKLRYHRRGVHGELSPCGRTLTIPMPVRETKSNELVELLNRLAEQPSEFQLAKAKREAKALVSKDANEGYTLLGIIAALEQNAGEMHRNHRLAIQNAPNNWWGQENYAKSLFRLGYFSEASDLASRLADRDPTHLDILRTAIGASTRAGKLERAIDLYARAGKLNYEDGAVRNDMEAVFSVVDFLRSAGITEAVLEKAVSIAASVAHESDAILDDVRLQVLSDDSPFVSLMLLVKRPAAVTPLSVSLVDRMMEEMADFPADQVSVGFLSVS